MIGRACEPVVVSTGSGSLALVPGGVSAISCTVEGMRSEARALVALLASAVMAFGSGHVARADPPVECPRTALGQACCTGGWCTTGICYDPGSTDGYFCAVCLPLPGAYCDPVQETTACDDAGNICSDVGEFNGTFADGTSVGAEPLACTGGTPIDAGPPSTCYAPPDAGSTATSDAGAAASDSGEIASGDASVAPDSGTRGVDASVGGPDAGPPEVVSPSSDGSTETADGSAVTAVSSGGGCSCGIARDVSPFGMGLVMTAGALVLSRRRRRTV
jgi:hypothetical protein